MNATQYSVMITLHFSMSQGKNHYTRSSINKILQNLSKYHDITIERRWLFECIKRLIDAGYIRRRTRHRNDSLGLISQIPSLLMFTLKGIVWLLSKGVETARQTYTAMRARLKKKDKRWPKKADFENGYSLKDDPAIPERLKQMLGKILTSI